MTTTYTLADAEKRHAAHPDTFFIPSASDRENLDTESTVKLIFECGEPDEDGFKQAERMWVQITERHEDGSYTGKLDNHPVFIEAKAGDVVKFEPRHIINIYDR